MRGVRAIGVLLQGNRFALASEVHFQARRVRRDRQTLISELADHVKRLARRLLERESDLVLRDCALDLGAHVRCCFEEAIRRYEPVERLVRSLVVVVVDVVLEPALRVDDVREDRAAEKLVPQCLPEALDLAERLRVLRAAPDVLDTAPLQLLLELGLTPPHRVLAPVVGQHLRRLSVRGDPTFEGLHHERRLLVMCQRVPDHEAAVVIHEDAHVQPLRAPQPKREDVRLPELIHAGPLEAPRPVLLRRGQLRRLDESRLVKNPPHLRLTHSQRLEAGQCVTDATRPPLLVFELELHHLLTLHTRLRARLGPRLSPLLRLQARTAQLPELRQPLRDCGAGHPEGARHVLLPGATQPLLADAKLDLHWHLAADSPFRSYLHRCLPFG